MGKPFEVTIMHDVPEPKKKKAPLQGRVSEMSNGSAGQLAAAIVSSPTHSSKEEVIESIESLRPDTTMLEDHQYKTLSRALDQAYNTKQLSLYLKESLQFSSIDADTIHIVPKTTVTRKGGMQRLPWRAGSTALSERHSKGEVIAKSDVGRSKAAVIAQVLRFAWNLTNVTEWQYVGELEVKLEGWQLAYLFDLSSTESNEPMHQTFIDTTALRENSEIRAYLPDNVMRITARLMDAESIADQIEQNIHKLPRLMMDLTKFGPLFGQTGRPRSVAQFLESKPCVDVSRRTATVFEVVEGITIVVHGGSSIGLRTARRMLLSLLDLSSASTIQTLQPHYTYGDTPPNQSERTQSLAPEYDRADLHFRYRDLELARLVTAKHRTTSKHTILNDSAADSSRASLIPTSMSPSPNAAMERRDSNMGARQLAGHLTSLESLTPNSDTLADVSSELWSYSSPLKPSPWRVQLCRLLRLATEENMDQLSEETPIPSGNSSSTDSALENTAHPIVHSRTPHAAALLSYFSVRRSRLAGSNQVGDVSSDADAYPPFLVAHFMPSPFTAIDLGTWRSLPSIEVYYKSTRDIQPTRVVAKFHNQEVRVPLPDEAVDLRFVRDIVIQLRSIQDFDRLGLARFTQSLSEAAGRGEPMEEPVSIVQIKLPAWMDKMDAGDGVRNAREERDVDIEYIFDRFELTSSTSFPRYPNDVAPLESFDPMLKQTLDNMDTGTSMRYTDIEGDYLDGSRSELVFRNPLNASRWQKSDSRTALARSQGRGRRIGPDNAEDKQIINDGERAGTLNLVETAFGLAQAISRFACGELKPAWGSGDDGGRISTPAR
ncbi:hypothetical protein LTR09_003499 [Extremus antarcticus]|uniref:Uncharacterized protein n=1 Tax=Extremus antarcticus TaxID=702011 RepID=A0AAJ0GAG1_9PEZI|nr:hypothetical protein LTR09_003499 [Extremus antarcticus]